MCCIPVNKKLKSVVDRGGVNTTNNICFGLSKIKYVSPILKYNIRYLRGPHIKYSISINRLKIHRPYKTLVLASGNYISKNQLPTISGKKDFKMSK